MNLFTLIIAQARITDLSQGFLSDAVILALLALGVLVALVTVWNGIRSRPPHEAPTRREFDDLKKQVGDIESDLAPMERRILDGVKEIGKELSAKIEHLGEHEYTARGELWEKLNAPAERVAAEESKSNLAINIAKAITETAKKS